MQLFDTTHLALERAIEGASMRQSVLAGNLANANTPGYQRRDVDFQGALRNALRGGSAGLHSVSFSPQVRTTGGAVRADGNGVDVDVEAADMAKNGLLYQALTQVHKVRDDILRSAMGL